MCTSKPQKEGTIDQWRNQAKECAKLVRWLDKDAELSSLDVEGQFASNMVLQIC